LKVQLGLNSVWAGLFLYYKEVAIGAAEQRPVPNEQEDLIDRSRSRSRSIVILE